MKTTNFGVASKTTAMAVASSKRREEEFIDMELASQGGRALEGGK